MLALLTAFISVLLNQAFSPDAEQLATLAATTSDFASSTGMGIQEVIQQMTPEQQMVLLKVSAAATFSALVGNVLLVGGMLTLIRLVSQGERTSALRALGASAPDLPRLLLLLFICTLLIQLGLTLFVVPGVLMAIAFALAPVIASVDKKGVFASLKLSSKLAFGNARVIVPAMMLWLAAAAGAVFGEPSVGADAERRQRGVDRVEQPGVCPAADLPVPPVHAAARLTPTQQNQGARFGAPLLFTPPWRLPPAPYSESASAPDTGPAPKSALCRALSG